MLMEMLKQWIGGASKRHERVIHERVIHESGLFDAEWYSRRNRVNRRSAIRHFLAVGAQGGADPSPLFSTKSYLSRYPDVAAARACPHLSQASAQTSCNPARKLRAVFS
jgi:hypothetical protein